MIHDNTLTYHNKKKKINPIPKRVSILNVIHNCNPTLQTDYLNEPNKISVTLLCWFKNSFEYRYNHLKYSYPRITNIVKRNRSLKRILITWTAFRIIRIPINAIIVDNTV